MLLGSISTEQARKIWWAGVVTFRGRCAGNLLFWPKSTFRDRCKGSEQVYFEMQISWQVQHFGCGGDLGGALIS